MRLIVRVRAGAKLERVRRIDEQTYKVWVRTAPEQGKANKRVVELLAENLGISQSCVTLIRGHTSPTKIFDIKTPKA